MKALIETFTYSIVSVNVAPESERGTVGDKGRRATIKVSVSVII